LKCQFPAVIRCDTASIGSDQRDGTAQNIDDRFARQYRVRNVLNKCLAVQHRTRDMIDHGGIVDNLLGNTADKNIAGADAVCNVLK